MKLKILNIIFQGPKDFLADVDDALKSGKKLNTRKKNTLIFDSVKTFNNLMTVNKIQVLRAISQSTPSSVYQLALILNREPHHVLKDCRQLEACKFIELELMDSGRQSLRPTLTFDYDVIKADSPIIPPYTISERAEKLLFDNQVIV